MEVWKDVFGFEGLYLVSSRGQVMNLDRMLPCKNGTTRICKSKIIKPCKRLGYLAVTLVARNSQRTQILIHRLVAAHFIPNPENKPQVNHKDGNKHNNFINNLEWATRSENMLHSYRLGLHKPNKPFLGKENHYSSRPVKQFDKDGNFIKLWPSGVAACRYLGGKSCSSGITQACRRNIKTYYGFKWSYAPKITSTRIDKELNKIF